MPTPPDRLIHSYGRRRGRPLRVGRAELIEQLLPRLAIPAPAVQSVVDPATLFPRPPAAVWLEIGFGAGEHLAAQAEAHREVAFIGAEPYVNGTAGLLARVHEARLDNIRVWPNDIRLLVPAFPAASLGRVFILFPDPWPKARHHKRRLVARPFLDELARVMAPGAELRLATDDAEYRIWMLEHVMGHTAFEGPLPPGIDVQRRPDDWPPTRYEAKALAAGRPPAYLKFVRRG